MLDFLSKSYHDDNIINKNYTSKINIGFLKIYEGNIILKLLENNMENVILFKKITFFRYYIIINR